MPIFWAVNLPLKKVKEIDPKLFRHYLTPMLKFFFNRESLIVRLMEILGIMAFGIFVWRYYQTPSRTLFFLSFLFAGYAFIRLCDIIPWHQAKNRQTGIRVHFQKAVVPCTYILAITNLTCLLNIPYASTLFMILGLLMTSAVLSVNVILVYFYFKDKDPLPINHFSSNSYLRGDTALPLTTPSGGRDHTVHSA